MSSSVGGTDLVPTAAKTWCVEVSAAGVACCAAYNLTLEELKVAAICQCLIVLLRLRLFEERFDEVGYEVGRSERNCEEQE